MHGEFAVDLEGLAVCVHGGILHGLGMWGVLNVGVWGGCWVGSAAGGFVLAGVVGDVLQTFCGMPQNVCRPSGRAPTGRCYDFWPPDRMGWLQFLSAQLWGLGGGTFLFSDVFHQAFAFSFLSRG